MSAVSIRLSHDVATVQCERCTHAEAIATDDRPLLLTAVREFLQAHEHCADVSGGRVP